MIQEYAAVAKGALKWLHNSTPSSTADEAVAEIHARLGRYMFREQGLEKLGVASAHLARSRDMHSLTDVVSQAARVSHSSYRVADYWFADGQKEGGTTANRYAAPMSLIA